MTYEEELQLISDKLNEFNDSTWEDIKDELNYPYTTDALRKSAAGKYGGKAVFEYFKNKQYSNNSDELLNIQKERIKLNDTKNEYKELIRSQARNESFNEKIIEAINNLPELKHIYFNNEAVKTDRIGVLCFGDAHYGKEIILYGLNGDIINEYSPDIFRNRMYSLSDKLFMDSLEVPIDKLIIVDVGDCVEGVLRTGTQLRQLKTGVIDSAIEYSEFIAQWLNELQQGLNIPLEYHLVQGNHDCLRLLNSKPQFEDENIAKIIHQFISLRLKNNEAITVAPYNGVAYFSVFGNNVFAYHGDDKNLQDSMEFFENYYNINIDTLITGHLHHNEQTTIGYGSIGDREIIRIPSICGTDNFAKKVRKASYSGAKYLTYDIHGKAWERNYILP